LQNLYTEISQFEPLFPSETGEIEDLAYRLVETSARLEGRLSPATLSGIAGLLRVVNSFYSNLIEGHNTHPIDIQKAMRREYSDDEDKRDLQIESRIHIEVQQKIFERLAAEPETNVAAPEFLCWIHGEFYEQMPERLRWAKGEAEEKAWVEAGKVRNDQVVVGRHLPPTVCRHFEEKFQMNFLDGSAFLNHHFVKLGWLSSWRDLLPQDEMKEIFLSLEQNLNAYSNESGGLSLTVPMAFIEGEKA